MLALPFPLCPSLILSTTTKQFTSTLHFVSLLSHTAPPFSFHLCNYQALFCATLQALPPTYTSCLSVESITDHLYCVPLDHLDGESRIGKKEGWKRGEVKILHFGLFVWVNLLFPSSQTVLKINHNFLPVWYHQGNTGPTTKLMQLKCVHAHVCVCFVFCESKAFLPSCVTEWTCGWKCACTIPYNCGLVLNIILPHVIQSVTLPFSSVSQAKTPRALKDTGRETLAYFWW